MKSSHPLNEHEVLMLKNQVAIMNALYVLRYTGPIPHELLEQINETDVFLDDIDRMKK